MQFDRLVARTIFWLAWGGFAGLRRPAPAPALVGNGHAASAPRGSGSWANDWTGARSAVARAKSLALPGRSRAARKTGPVAGGTVRTKPLMSLRGVRLHNWIADRMEVEAPTCSLHSGVALGAFMTASAAHEENDPLRGLVADMLIADENGQPVAALILENTADRSRHLRLVDALLDADLPIVAIPNRPSLAGLWADISKVLPKD